jgi:hypothetical protein
MDATVEYVPFEDLKRVCADLLTEILALKRANAELLSALMLVEQVSDWKLETLQASQLCNLMRDLRQSAKGAINRARDLTL